MSCRILLLIIFSIFYTITSLNPIFIAYNEIDSNYYLVIDDKYCLLSNPVEATIKSFGFTSITTISTTINSNNEYSRSLCPFKIDYMDLRDVNSLSVYDLTNICIDYRKLLLYKSKLLIKSNEIVKSVINIGKYVNPSTIPFNNHLIMAYRYFPNDSNCQRLVSMDYDGRNIEDLSFTNTSHFTDYTEEDIRFTAQPNGNILMSFSYYFSWYRIFMSIKTLSYNKSTRLFDMSKSINLDYKERTNYEKNWTPFYHKNELYFIQKMFPLKVLKLVDSEIYQADIFKGRYYRDSLKVYTFSNDNCTELNYINGFKSDFGKIRGGTPTVLIKELGYFGFFHTRGYDCQITYLFGAYLFSKKPPFTMIKMSHIPIITDDIMIFNATVNHRNESIIFPMTFYMEDKNANILSINDYSTKKISTVVVSSGYNDTNGLLIKLDFQKLIDSMTALINNCK